MNASQRTAELRRYRLLNWSTVLVDHLDRNFREAVKRGVVAAFQENLFVHHDPQHRSVTLLAGHHPVGNSLKGTGIAVEGGAALTVSQGIDGSVAFFLYPFSSELMRRTEDKILWARFKSPDVVRERTIKKAIADAARYWRVSSALDGGSRFDRLCVDYLLLKAQIREALARSSWLAKTVKIGLSLVGVIGFLSALATLAGTSVPQLWSRLHPPAKAGMPVIAGWYTFCSQDKTGASPKLLDLLYDIQQNAGKVVFFDVQVDVACVMETPFDAGAAFSRKAGERSLTYSFSPGKFAQEDLASTRPGVKDPLVPDNGTLLTVLDDSDGRNALTRLAINAEGVDDVLYGPYLIKASGEDAVLTLTLSAPTLDSTMQEAATTTASQLRKAHEADPPPNDVPSAIALSEAELRKSHELASPPAANSASGVPAPISLPPLDAKTLRQLSPLPAIPPIPQPSSLPKAAANIR
ncbi:hypothetical protein [Ralstonia insidiosa]|uniref:hypothetical protein n=1 Tax=Ralstonia insidiosa TaxID=190721 RepID=UPI001427E9DC|nr:hypothetical protein [Ralstonia insidiosa]